MSLYESLRDAIKAEEPVALVTIVEGEPLGAKLLVRLGDGPARGRSAIPSSTASSPATREAELDAGLSSTRHYGPEGQARQDEVGVFIESFAPPPRLLIFGAVDFTAALTRIGKVLGYRVVVVDARPVFATPARFPMADEVVVDWPDRYLAGVGDELGPRDAVCVLTHDHKFDVPAVVAALRTRVGYLGAMGSRRTDEERRQRLRDAGVTDDQLGRLMAPIGLDIGARTPEETAVSICAEIIALRTGRRPPSLRDTEGPIHARGEHAS